MYLIFLLCFTPFFTWGETQENESGQILVSYPLPHTHHLSHLFREWKNGERLIPGKYNLKANIDLMTTLRSVESHSLELIPQRDANKDQSVSQPSNSSQPKSIAKDSLEPINQGIKNLGPINKEIKIDRFDELRLDYQDLVPENPSVISLKMVLSGEKLKGKTTPVVIKEEEKIQLIPGTLSDLVSSPWERKDKYYIAKRLLGLSFDSRWRFIFKPHGIFYQKRFHNDFSSIEAVDIVFKPEASEKLIKSIQCNLRFSFKSRLQLPRMVECRKFPQRLIKTGRKIALRLSLGNYIRSNLMENGDIQLNEIIFITPRNSIRRIQEQPIESIVAQSLTPEGLLQAKKIQKDLQKQQPLKTVFHFTSAVEGRSGQPKQLILPLRQFYEKTGKNGKIQSLTVLIEPRNLQSPFKTHLKSLRAVGYKEEARPSILSFGEKSYRWGVNPFSETEGNNGKFERILIKGYLPFYSPAMDKQNTSIFVDRRAKQGKPTDTINFFGTSIRAQDLFTGWQSNERGLRFSGKGNWVEITWPIKGNFEGKNHFFMGVGEGEENIQSLQLIPMVEGKNIPPIAILPNKAIELKNLSGYFNGINLRIHFLKNDFILQLKELALLRPSSLSNTQILDTPFLVEGETPLIPKNIHSVPDRKVLQIKGHLGSSLFFSPNSRNEISWETDVRRKVSSIQGMKISYKMFPPIKLRNPCWLNFTLVNSNRKISHTLCPEGSSGQVMVSRETLFKNSDFKTDETLEHIGWKIESGTLKSSTQKIPQIDIGAKIMGHDFRTLRNILTKYPFIQFNGKYLYPKSLDRVNSDQLLSGKFSAFLSTIAIKEDDKNISSFELLEHPHLKIKNILLEKIEPITQIDLASLMEEHPEPSAAPDSKGNSSFFKSVLILVLFLAIIWGLKISGVFHRLQEMLKFSPNTAGKQFLLFISLAVGFYLLGFFFHLIRWLLIKETFLSLAGIPLLLATRNIVWWGRPHLESNLPGLVTHIYRGPGTPYLAGFFLVLPLAIFFLVIQVTVLAEHLGVLCYYLLIVGVYLEVRDLRHEKTNTEGEENPLIAENEAERA